MIKLKIGVHECATAIFLAALCHLAFADSNRLSVRNLNYLSKEYIDSAAAKIEKETDVIKKYEIIDSIGVAQLSDNMDVKDRAYTALFNISRNKDISVDLRRSAALQAMNAKNGSIQTIEVLHYARSENLIDEEKYYGILASYFQVADEKLKLSIIDELDDSKSEYGKHILLVQNHDIQNLQNLSREILSRLMVFAKSNLPKPTSRTNVINIIDFHAMQGWLLLYGNAEALLNGQDFNQVVSDFVILDATDPKYAVAYVLTEQFSDSYLSKRAMSKDQYKFRQKINELIEKYKEHKEPDMDIFLKSAMEKLD